MLLHAQEPVQEEGRWYLHVVGDFSDRGELRPLAFTWTDGRTYRIDRIRRAQKVEERKDGGEESGIRYDCSVGRNEVILWFSSGGRWYLEDRGIRC